MTKEQEEKILLSHDELIRVCQAALRVIIKFKKFKKFEAELLQEEVEPGFAQRAEEVSKEIHWERRILLAQGKPS